MNFIFLRFIEVWTQWVSCKLNVVPYFARDPLHSFFNEPQKNEIYFLNIIYDIRAINNHAKKWEWHFIILEDNLRIDEKSPFLNL